ncbi:MAG: FliA/WhiG family RNA polymerase sigma factor [Planctomycetota bacterium]
MASAVQAALTKECEWESEPIERLWGSFLKTRCLDLRNRLVLVYLPLVRGVAARISRRLPHNVEIDDLISAGVFGLVNAVENFDPERAVKFETYCRKRVSGAMLDELRRQDWIPREARERTGQMRRTVVRLRGTLERDPDDAEVAAALGQSLRTLHDTVNDLAFATRLPLDPHVSESGDGEGHRARVEPVDAHPEPPDQVFHQELLNIVDGQLSLRERTIVHSYYHEEQTMKRIGNRLRLSESRVCQMHMHLLTRLKERLYQEVAP